MDLFSEIKPPEPGKYLVFGTAKNRTFFWVEVWNGESFEGMAKNRKVLYWEDIDISQFLSFPENTPSYKGRFLVTGTKNGKPDVWVISWSKLQFNVYPRQVVTAFQELPVI